MGVYLNRIGTVKYSHNWPVKGSPPGNPEEDAYIKKEVILHKSLFFFFFHHLAFFSTASVASPGGGASPRSFCLRFTGAASLRPSRCRAAGVALEATHSHSSALQS